MLFGWVEQQWQEELSRKPKNGPSHVMLMSELTAAATATANATATGTAQLATAQ